MGSAAATVAAGGTAEAYLCFHSSQQPGELSEQLWEAPIGLETNCDGNHWKSPCAGERPASAAESTSGKGQAISPRSFQSPPAFLFGSSSLSCFARTLYERSQCIQSSLNLCTSLKRNKHPPRRSLRKPSNTKLAV